MQSEWHSAVERAQRAAPTADRSRTGKQRREQRATKSETGQHPGVIGYRPDSNGVKAAGPLEAKVSLQTLGGER